ncbi:MAG: leucine-rich repeat domain-containing protein [Oscillospiraceae bacterium]|nr:leucine-rich repeat domain-containing protein [Oscillospiraceae bacterium]
MKKNQFFSYIDQINLSDEQKERLITQTMISAQKLNDNRKNRSVLTLISDNSIKSGVTAAAMCLLFAGACFLFSPNRNEMPILLSQTGVQIDESGISSDIGDVITTGEPAPAKKSESETTPESQETHTNISGNAGTFPAESAAPKGLTAVSTADSVPSADETKNKAAGSDTMKVSVPPPASTEPPQAPETSTSAPPVEEPEPSYKPQEPETIVHMDLSYQDIDNQHLSEMVVSGEIPDTVEELILKGNPISDFAPLEELTNLTTLYLPNNLLITDFTPLKELMNLTFLSLGYNLISPEQLNELKENLPDLIIFDYYYVLYD